MPFPYENQTSKKWGFGSKRSSRSGRKPLPPCRTLDELAQMFGVTRASLLSYMQHNPGAPSPTGATCTGSRTGYYPLPAMVKWWNEVIAPKRAVSQSLLIVDN